MMYIFFNPLYHIYLLQLENFNLQRFIRAAVRDCFSPPAELRKPITWTAKITITVSLALITSIGVVGLAGWWLSALFSSPVVGWLSAVILLSVLAVLFFIPLTVATVLLLPVDWLIRFIIRRRAIWKVSRLEDLTIIGVTGSYGKTTMKQTLFTLLDGPVNAVATSESHNTPVAVSRSVLADVDESTDVFIVEMGAYGRGDIAALCAITPPDISILTGINEAHLERFGSLENTIQAKFEIVTEADPEAKVILNADDKLVRNNFTDFTADKTVQFYSAKNHDRCQYEVYDKRFHEDGTGISFRVKKDDDPLGYVKVNHLADYIIGNIIAGLCVGDLLGIDQERILKQAHNITPAEHRLQPIQRTRGNVLVIDDSYNGNPDGAQAAIDVLEKFIGRRTIYVTPGLVEMGDRAEEVHKKIGQRLAAVVDVVVLVETSVTDWIKEGLESAAFGGELHTFESPQAMHENISDILHTGDVLLFQNDWPENYQ